MIRFRIGQSWKRERSAPPVDSFGLDLDGVDLLSGASEEPLVKVVPDLIDALYQLSIEGRPIAQVSLHEANLELAMHRQNGEVALSVVSLGRPAKLVRPAVRLELSELTEAAVRCGRLLLKDLTDAAPAMLRSARNRQMMRRLTVLERGRKGELEKTRSDSGFGYRQPAAKAGTFGFALDDADDLLLTYDARASGALPSLLAPGAVTWKVTAAHDWRLAGVPYLLTLELSRQAGELAHAIELDDEQFTFSPGGVGPRATVKLREKKLEWHGPTSDVDPPQLAREMFELGLSFSFAATTRNKSQSKNPYLVELVERCREGLSALRDVVKPSDDRPAKEKRRGSVASRPLKTHGKLRRLFFEPRWEKSSLGGDSPGRLLLSVRGPIFSSLEMACGFSADGELLFRRVATHGVAAASDGRVVTASLNRLTSFRCAEGSARWIRDHDGQCVGPDLLEKDGLLIAPAGTRGVVAFSEMTGREAWRIEPPRTQRSHIALQGHRVLLATDSGYLYGLDVKDGQVRFRMRAALPFGGPTVPWGKRLLAMLWRGERSAVFAADAHSGNIAWTRELQLDTPSQPIAVGTRVMIAGYQDQDAVLVCLGRYGQPLWEKKLHLGSGPLSLLGVGRMVLAQDRSGAATMVGSDGRIEWRVGAPGEELARTVAPHLVRGVLIVPGESVRAIDPRGGRVLGEVAAGVGLVDLKVDARLNLYLLDEDGSLRAYRLSSHFAVV